MSEDFEFDTGIREAKPFEAEFLPDTQKLALCEGLLSSLGVTRWRKTPRGELIHSCPMPGRHRNGDRSPSASLNYRKLKFHCFGCGSGGNILWFVASVRHIETSEARQWLEGQTGLGGTVMDVESLMEFIDALYAKPEARVMPRYAARTLDPWLSWTTPHPYLTDPIEAGGRAIPADTCWHFSVGYAPEYELYLGSRTPTVQERVVIPLWWRDELVGWQARAIDDADEPKYHNTPDFPRDVAVFNYAPRVRTAMVVESPMSVLRHWHHQPDLISTYGASVSDEQMRLLRRYDQVVVWFDNDKSGWEGAERIIEELPAFTDLRVVASDLDADPADLDDHIVAQLRRDAVPWPIWARPERLRPKEMA